VAVPVAVRVDAAVVLDLDLDVALAVADDDPGVRRPVVLERMRERLLHDPVGGDVDAGG
jgi:hypothetical protein